MTLQTITERSTGWVRNLLLIGVPAVLAYLLFTFLAPDRDLVKDAVAARMRDPSSVQFRDLTGEGDTVCGEVNAKNGFGAYVGFQRFVYRRGVVFLEPQELPIMTADQQSRHYADLVRFARYGKDCYK